MFLLPVFVHSCKHCSFEHVLENLSLGILELSLPHLLTPPFDDLLLQAQICSVSPNSFFIFLYYPCGVLI
jgi:hypothetical protein